jgi:hypothetical protein
MAFVKVVGGSEIYNFRIQSLVHLFSKFWSYSCLNRDSAKQLEQPHFALQRRAAMLRPLVVHTHAPPEATANRGCRSPRRPRPNAPCF